VARSRLVAELTGSPVGVVEAAAGCGKSVLAGEYHAALGISCVWVPLGPPDDDPSVLVSSLRRGFRAAKLSDLYSALDGGDPEHWPDRFLDALTGLADPLLVVLDDAHHLPSRSAAALVMRIAKGIALPHRLLVTGRWIPDQLDLPGGVVGAASLGVADLAFTDDETAELAAHVLGREPAESEVRALAEATGGWASALILAARAMREDTYGGGTPVPVPTSRGIIAALMDGVLRSLSPAQRDALFQLAHLPFLSPEITEALASQAGPRTRAGDQGMFEAMVDAGVPLLHTAMTRWEMPGPVTAYLTTLAPLSPQAAAAAAAIYRGDGNLPAAVRMLIDAGHSEQAVALLADLDPREAEDLGWAEIRNAVEALPAAVLRRHPRALLHLARTAETAYRMDMRRQALAQVAGVAAQAAGGRLADPAVHREFLAEQARDLVWDERTRERARSLAEAVVAEATETEVVARARALDALGRLRSWWSGDGPHDDAAPLLEESARLARRLGHPVWAARALMPLAMGVHFGLCRYHRALAALDQALVLFPARGQYRATILAFRSTVLAELGSYAEAAASIAEMRQLAEAQAEEWLHAYVCWSEAELASYQGDRELTVRAVHAVLQHKAAWFDETPGVEFLAQAADFLDRVGEHAMATDYLNRARQRSSGFERVVRVYESAVLGRSGPPAEAEQVIAATLARPDLDPQERWPLLLLRAYAALRRGDPAAAELAAAAFETCLELGVPQAPVRRERAVCEALLPLAAQAGSVAAATLLGHGGKVSVRLLGGFEVRRGSQPLHPPPGRPATAIKAVVAAGGRMHAEELIEVLWPDAGPGQGRNRLKNLLSRLRASVGDVLIRDADSVLLAPGGESDAASFEAEARRALTALAAGDQLRAAMLARSAMDRYSGDLLPGDRYEPWAAEPRERLRLRYLELIDLLAARAEASGEADEAARLVQRAIDTEPYDEERYLKLAGLFAEQGRSGSAGAVLRRAKAMLGELGIPPSPEFAATERSLTADLSI
jgi:DNA-binding SARP family transcriptional activator/ATP/maltotriose-dependent transcriptional regulator MalT